MPKLNTTYLDNARFGPDNTFKADRIFCDAVSNAPSGSVDHSIFVELGTDTGRSAAFMAGEIKFQKKRHCISFSSVDMYAEARGITPFQVANNLGSLYGDVYLIESDSAEAAKQFDDESVDFLFIDAGHETAQVLQDIKAWSPKMKPDGVMAGDDLWWFDDNDRSTLSNPRRELEQSVPDSVGKIEHPKLAAYTANTWVNPNKNNKKNTSNSNFDVYTKSALFPVGKAVEAVFGNDYEIWINDYYALWRVQDKDWSDVETKANKALKS